MKEKLPLPLRVVRVAFPVIIGVGFSTIGLSFVQFASKNHFGFGGFDRVVPMVFGGGFALLGLLIAGSAIWTEFFATPEQIEALQRQFKPKREFSDSEQTEKPVGSQRSSRTLSECPSCGAPVTDGRNVSPSGEYRCPHCDRWVILREKILT